ncbi:MAG: 4-(cytidine 5'-diphospho)-2-C-methyl-D-erythritol kinase [Solirubrobacteraceae bacterium]
MKLIEQAPAKINLCLYLGGVRGDLRHELVTVYESVSLMDTLTLTLAPGGAGRDEVICPSVEGPNLVAVALEVLRSLGWLAPPVRIEIAKRIPVAAGMAGGSADAAAALRLARALGESEGYSHARLAWSQLFDLARALGSDVPAQLDPGLSLGTGAGEVVEQLAPLAEHAFVIVPLDFALSTPAVYGEADRLGLPRPQHDFEQRLAEVSGWFRRGAQPPPRLLVNDLELAARSLCPAIGPALEALRDAGAQNALVCGSGPTCAGVWWGSGALEAASAAARSLQAVYPRSAAVRPIRGA